MKNKVRTKKTNICRPIFLFNNFLPTSKEKNYWQYIAFGSFDGISVGGAFSSDNSGEILKQLWKHQGKYYRGLRGQAAVQIIYALCYEEIGIEEEFWKENEKPFTFFCRLQFDKNINELRRNKGKIEEIIKSGCNALVKIYTTYDNSDLLIVIKAGRYDEGIEIINSFHQGINFALNRKNVCKLKNSFTIFALKQEFVNRTLDEAFVAELNKERIKKAYVNIVKRRCTKKADWKKIISSSNRELRGKVKGEFVLGADDEVVFFRNIGWGDFLKLYQDSTGIFNNTSEEYQQFIAGTATIICGELTKYPKIWTNWKDVDETGGKDQLVVQERKENDNTLYKAYIDRLREKVIGLYNGDKQMKEEKDVMYKELYVILNTLPKYSEEVFSDYVFFVILRPLSTLIELLEEGFNDSYYEFIKAFNLSIQNSVKSDKHAMQIIDFNTKIYDIPTKLNAFYTAYIYKVSDVLNIKGENSKEHLYDFVVIPGVTNFVNVLELFQRVSEDKRLLRVEIPENRFYDIENIMIIFAHEAAHYVGTAIRRRKERYEDILCSIAYMYIDYVKSYTNEIKDICPDLAIVDWDIIAKRCKYILHEMLEREVNENYLKNYAIGLSEQNKEEVSKVEEYNKKYKEHFSFVEKNIFRAMSDIVEHMLPNIFGSLVFDLSNEQAEKVYEIIGEISIRFMGINGIKTTKITLESTLKRLKYIYEECFADIIAITLLDLDAKEYLNSIIEENRQQVGDIEVLSRSEVIYRIGLVLNVMGKNEKTEKLNFYDEDKNKNDRMYILDAVGDMLDCIKEGWNNGPEEYRECSVFALMNKEIYGMAFRYLDECRRVFVKQLEEDVQRKEKCQQLRKFLKKYKNSNGSNIEEQVSEIEEMIDDYKKRLSEELQEYLMK